MSVITPVDPTAVSLRLPNNSGWEAGLNDAYERGRADARGVLTKLLAGFDVGANVDQVDGGTLQVSQKAIDLATWIDPMALLDRYLAAHDAGEPRIKTLRDSQITHPGPLGDRPYGGEFTLATSARLLEVLESGQTIVFDGLDRKVPTIRRLNELISRVFRTAGNVNGYLSLQPHPGFGAHWDNHEVLIIQLIGHKHWEVHEPSALSPHTAVIPPETTGAVVWDGVMEPGDFLYLPRGWGHDVRGMNALTFHLTVTIPRMGIPDLLDGAVAASQTRPGALDGVEMHHPIDQSMGANVRHLIERATTKGALDNVIATYRCNMLSAGDSGPRQLVEALRAKDPDLLIRCPHPGGFVRAEETDSQEPTLVYSRRGVTVPVFVASGLARFTDGRVYRLGDVLDEIATAENRSVIGRELLTTEMFQVVSDPAEWGLVNGQQSPSVP